MPFRNLAVLAACAACASAQNLKLLEWTEKQRAKHTLAVQDWRPVSNAVVPVTRVPRSKFPSVDVHAHISRATDTAAIGRVLKVMDDANVRTVVHLTGGFGQRLKDTIESLRTHGKGRFITCTQIDWSRIDSPTFSTEAVRGLEEAHHAGARCLKITEVLGLVVKDSSGRFVAVNDPRLDAIWAKAGELKMPVMMHIADPIAFFRPWDEKNEAYSALAQHPDWWFYGEDHEGRARFRHEELMRQRDDVVARHPKTQFVALHYGSLSHDLAAVGRLLDRFP
ncbi:MAG TPA: amidohydrolase family protein, partial [Bryobacteraceae bacterium]|nr:amidohydrolase family protein [Bryobacteraceae bacterium]